METEGTPTDPAPIAPPRGLLAGCVTLTRARLLDAFGRTLEVPVAQVATPTRATCSSTPSAPSAPSTPSTPTRWTTPTTSAARSATCEYATSLYTSRTTLLCAVGF